ncbi:chemotaxis regulatin CheY-phosphate phosphatase CheZ [Chelatococcus caeni]|uniref:Chemotaxis regulatin CheY-phosphate phosphatase CheZ n=1 Tax=Chelatococcus caeni TaxID=1348468 RepID=A0A840C8K9_9HYPH|nr:chemotaxis regulatin CheY-phosphate phosphatase CheZ [Chelatococcus caeni]
MVGTLKFIEERVTSMMEIWGGPDSLSSLAEVEVEEEEEKGDEALLNGPPLAGDVDVVSQDDVDSLFR